MQPNPPKLKPDFFFGTTSDFPKIVELPLSAIQPNPDQPRKTFDETKLRELTASIERHGLLQPILVQKRTGEDGYLLVAGERRFRAHQRLEKATIPALVIVGKADEIALIENLQREDLNPLEEAEALQRMIDRYDYTQEALGQIIGKAQNTVSEVLRLNSLPPAIKTEYRTSDTVPVSKSALIELTRITDLSEQHALWDAMKAGHWTVRAARQVKRRSLPAVPIQERTLEMGRAFLQRVEALDVIDADPYQTLLALSEALQKHLDRLRPPQSERPQSEPNELAPPEPERVSDVR